MDKETLMEIDKNINFCEIMNSLILKLLMHIKVFNALSQKWHNKHMTPLADGDRPLSYYLCTKVYIITDNLELSISV